MSYTYISPVCQYSDVIYYIAIFVEGYLMWSLVKPCAEIVKIFKFPILKLFLENMLKRHSIIFPVP